MSRIVYSMLVLVRLLLITLIFVIGCIFGVDYMLLHKRIEKLEDAVSQPIKIIIPYTEETIILPEKKNHTI